MSTTEKKREENILPIVTNFNLFEKCYMKNTENDYCVIFIIDQKE